MKILLFLEITIQTFDRYVSL